METIEFQHDGLALVADAHGSPADPPVLLAHGGGQTRHAWAGTAARLGTTGWYAVTVDLRGHGDSDWSPTGAYHLSDFAGDLRSIVADLGQPAVLVGASLGGMSALLASYEAPDPDQLVKAIVLVDIAPKIESDGVERIMAFMTAHPDGFASLDEVADVIAAYNPHRPRPRNLDGLRKNLRQGEDGRWRWHWDPKFLEQDPDEPRVSDNVGLLDDAASALTVPTLVVRGMMSDLLSEEGVEHLKQLVPHAEVADVAGAGHMVAGDRNDIFNDAVTGFLDRSL